jgi:hypothetical protein
MGPMILATGPPGETAVEIRGPTHLLKTSVIGSGGSPGTTSRIQHSGTLGQPTPIGIGTTDTTTLYAGFWPACLRSTVLTEMAVLQPLENRVFANYPNPFNPSTTISYSVARESPVRVQIYNVRGERVRTLLQEVIQPGRHRTVWEGRDDEGRVVASGTYFALVQIGEYSAVQKMLLVK